jgi:putative ABC transport system permease protein
MLKNYFLIAWRNLRKQPVFSVINIAGFSIGLAAFWLIALYVGDELSYDKYHKKADRIFRVAQHAAWKESGFDMAITSAPFAPALKQDYPEIEQAVRISIEGGGMLTVGEKSIKADNIFFTDQGFFSVFDYTFITGSPSTALKDPQTIVLTRTLAQNLFGDIQSAVGKTVYFQNNFPNTVTGVIEDVPTNSHFSFSALRSLPAGYTTGWQEAELYTYVLLTPGANQQKLQAKLPGFYKKHLEASMGEGVKYRLELQPLTSIHLRSNLEYELGTNGSLQYIYIFSIIGLLVLIIASINYMNLSTARSSYRVKEIGVRKVIGSGKSQLVWMFLAESVLICIFAGALAIFLADLVMPLFNQLSGKGLSLWRFGVNRTLVALFGFTVIAGLVSGIYPAFFMSGFNMIPSLKGQIGSRTGTVIFRKALVTFQFVVTIIMIAGSFIIYQQLNFIRNKNLGINKDQVLTFHIDDNKVREKTAALKQALLQNTQIEAVSAASNPIGNNNIGSNGFLFEENSSVAGSPGLMPTSARKVQTFMVDGDFVKTLEIKLAEGRSFSDQQVADRTGAVLVNEALVKELGWKQPIGKRVRFQVDQNGTMAESKVVGVVKDFHIYSLQHKLQPLVLQMPPEEQMKDNMYVRVKATNVPATLAFLKKTYLSFDPAANPEFRFLSENFNAQYKAEEKQGTLLLTLTVLAISIACLGLFGLVTFTAMQKSKEIGIRKVLGASVPGIVKLLSFDLLKLVFVAFVVATPIAWIVMQYWLQDFAYQVTLSWSVFVTAGLTAFAIALITLSVQAIRSALANPVKSLKVE